MLSTVLAALALSSSYSVSLAKQSPLLRVQEEDAYHQFDHEIRRVAVIGAGPNGLQAAAALIEEGLEVRLFERADQPAGNWYYRDSVVPIEASFPYVSVVLSITLLSCFLTLRSLNCCRNKPLVNSSYTPSIPDQLPHVKFYDDGEDGVSNSWRIREQENPSPVWASLTSIAPPVRPPLLSS